MNTKDRTLNPRLSARKLLLTILPLLVSLLAYTGAWAQSIVASAPNEVAVGQQFRLQYKVDVGSVSNFRLTSSFPENVDDLMGQPSQSSSMRIVDVNGKMTQEASVTYTYILIIKKAGTYTFPKATCTANGKKITSNDVKVKVVEQSSKDKFNAAGSGPDVFVTVTASQKRVLEQQPVLLTYKIYTRYQLDRPEYKLPNPEGFLIQEIPMQQEPSYKAEMYNGQQYLTLTWNQCVIFPQTTGKLRVPEVTYKTDIMIPLQVSIFEEMFNGGSNYKSQTRRITAPAVDIQVDPLPQRPDDFSGGVGQFTMSATLDKNEVKANEPITLKLRINGNGNLKLIKEPKVLFPQDFDSYDAKMNDSTRLSVNGMEGSVTFEYLAVPRNPGKYDIPPVELTYYDIAKKQYQTLRTSSLHLDVSPGEGGSTTVQHYGSQEDIQMLGNDIRFIKQGHSKVRSADDFFFGSATYWGLIVAMIVLTAVLFFIFRKQMRENADVVKQKGKKANKVAVKRLKKAGVLMRENRSNEFYEETLRALWGYVGDKLNMPVELLSRENVTDKLQDSQIDGAIVSQFVEAIDECEYARYAPGDPKGNMNKVYEKALNAIEQIEVTMKKGAARRPSRPALVMLLVVVALLSGHTASAQTKASADSCYMEGRYQEAIEIYEHLLEAGVSADIYYNLGNAYYRTENITRAIINYERALLLAPGDGDIRFNLQMARSRTTDKIAPASEMFFVRWYHSLVSMNSADGWARFALFTLVLALVLWLCYAFGKRLWLRKTGFFGGVLLIVLFLLGNLFAWQQKKTQLHRDGAIITAPSVTVKSTPDNTGVDLFVLHEGTKVKVEDAIKGWNKVKLPDGKEGWIGAEQMEVI